MCFLQCVLSLCNVVDTLIHDTVYKVDFAFMLICCSQCYGKENLEIIHRFSILYN